MRTNARPKNIFATRQRPTGDAKSVGELAMTLDISAVAASRSRASVNLNSSGLAGGSCEVEPGETALSVFSSSNKLSYCPRARLRSQIPTSVSAPSDQQLASRTRTMTATVRGSLSHHEEIKEAKAWDGDEVRRREAISPRSIARPRMACITSGSKNAVDSEKRVNGSSGRKPMIDPIEIG